MLLTIYHLKSSVLTALFYTIHFTKGMISIDKRAIINGYQLFVIVQRFTQNISILTASISNTYQ